MRNNQKLLGNYSRKLKSLRQRGVTFKFKTTHAAFPIAVKMTRPSGTSRREGFATGTRKSSASQLIYFEWIRLVGAVGIERTAIQTKRCALMTLRRMRSFQSLRDITLGLRACGTGFQWFHIGSQNKTAVQSPKLAQTNESQGFGSSQSEWI